MIMMNGVEWKTEKGGRNWHTPRCATSDMNQMELVTDHLICHWSLGIRTTLSAQTQGMHILNLQQHTEISVLTYVMCAGIINVVFSLVMRFMSVNIIAVANKGVVPSCHHLTPIQPHFTQHSKEYMSH